MLKRTSLKNTYIGTAAALLCAAAALDTAQASEGIPSCYAANRLEVPVPRSQRFEEVRRQFFSDLASSINPDKGGNLLNGGHGKDWFFKSSGDAIKQSGRETIESL